MNGQEKRNSLMKKSKIGSRAHSLETILLMEQS